MGCASSTGCDKHTLLCGPPRVPEHKVDDRPPGQRKERRAIPIHLAPPQLVIRV